jgi:hypothetical protein
MSFIAVFSDFPEFNPSWTNDAQYTLWTTFTAPSSGAIQVSMNASAGGGGAFWNDFGIAILDECNGDEEFCEGSFDQDDKLIITSLTPGETNITASWNNGYAYPWFDTGKEFPTTERATS